MRPLADRGWRMAGRRDLGAAFLIGALLAAMPVAGCRKRASPAGPAGAPPVITTRSGVKMVLLPGGWFDMGSAGPQQPDEKLHRVHVEGFYIDQFEVTQALYEQAMGVNPSRYRDPAAPVDQIRWTQAAAYCNARSRIEGLRPCYDPCSFACDFAADGYRLPTEAEWEYAARAGAATAYCFGDDPAGLRECGWYKGNQTSGPHPAGKLRPNAWGLYDVHGNVWEWCHDWYAEDYAAAGPQRDPRGPEAPDDSRTRILRGGCWDSRPDECRAAYRFNELPAFTDVCFGKAVSGFVGIRCVRRK